MSKRVAVILAASLLYTSAWGQTPKTIDTKYIYKDAAIVFVAHPKKMLARKSKLSVMIQQGVDGMKQVTGMDPTKLEQIVFQFGTETRDEDARASLGSDEVLTGVFRFSEPVDSDAIVQKSLRQNKKLMRNGQIFYQPPSESRVAAWAPDKKTLVIGAQWRLMRLMAKAEYESSLISKVQAADSTADATLEIDIDRGKPLFDDMLKNLPPVAPINQNTLKKLERLTLSMNWMSGKPSELTLYTKDPETAQQIHNQLSTLLATGKAAWPSARDSLLKGVQGPEKEMAEAAFGALDKLLAGTTTSAKKNKMNIQIAKDVDFVALGVGTFLSVRMGEPVERDEPVKE